MKKKLVVLINEKTSNDQYVGFLKQKYDVELVTFTALSSKEEEIPEIDLILFTGGEDVHPEFYNESVGKFTSSNKQRDVLESKMYRRLSGRTPKLGICRGAQFLTVMNGGKLVQHVENHGIGGTHSITFNHLYGGKTMPMTSTHHQMMYPFNMDEKNYVLCAHSTHNLSPKYWGEYDRNIELAKDFLEPEIVFYPNSNSLAIQGHPESGVMKTEDQQFILDYISSILKL